MNLEYNLLCILDWLEKFILGRLGLWLLFAFPIGLFWIWDAIENWLKPNRIGSGMDIEMREVWKESLIWIWQG